MRILHVIYDDIGNPWVGGGGATRTLEINRRIARQGHLVTVVCGTYSGAARVELRDGVRYRHVGLSSSHVASRLSYMAVAARLIKGGGYDIVIEDVSPYSPIGSPLWSRQVPAVASVQNLSGEHATAKYGALGLGPRLVEKPLLSRFKHFVAVSPGIAAQLRNTFGNRATVRTIPNSAGEVFFEAVSPGIADPPGRPGARGDYILSLGRIDVYQKGLDRLIKAFDTLAGRLPDVRLKIAGGGTEEQRARLAALVTSAPYGQRIDLLGQVDQGQAANLMRNALMLALPSRYEAWPLSAIEAGAAGVPVVGSDVVGVRDAAPAFPAAHGRLTPEGDVEALAEAMYVVATNPPLRSEMGKRGREWARRFTWDALADAQLQFYRQILHRGSDRIPRNTRQGERQKLSSRL